MSVLDPAPSAPTLALGRAVPVAAWIVAGLVASLSVCEALVCGFVLVAVAGVPDASILILLVVIVWGIPAALLMVAGVVLAIDGARRRSPPMVIIALVSLACHGPLIAMIALIRPFALFAELVR